jgi:nitrogen regulatory protein P-II 1
MEIKLIVAFMPRERLELVETKLRQLGVERIDVSKVKGYGEYHDFFSRDWMNDEVRIEVLTRRHKADAVAGAIMEAAHTGLPGDGVVAVLPVDKLFLIRTRAEATPEEFWPKPSLESMESMPTNQRSVGGR